MTQKRIWYIFYALVLASLLTPFLVFSQLFFPFITSKAFFFRIAVEAALPFYLYLLMVNPGLRPRLKQPLNLLVLAFLIVNFIASFAGANVSRSLWGNFERMGGAWYLLHLALLFFYVQTIGRAGGAYLKRFLQAFIAVAVLITVNGLSGWLGGPTLVSDPSLPGRVSSTFGNPIFFASYLVIPMFLSTFFAWQEKRRNLKIVYWAAAALQLVGIYASGTRGAVVGIILGSLIGAVLYAVFAKSAVWRRYVLSALGVFILAIAALYISHSKLPGGSTLYRVANLRDTNTDARLVQWKMALKGAKQNLLLGVGPENYYVIFDKHYNPEMYKYDPAWFDKPHNYLLEILATDGIFGLTAYICMFLWALYAVWKAHKSGLLGLPAACALAAALIAYEAQNIFVFDTVSASVAFYALLGFSAYLWAGNSLETESAIESRPAASGRNPAAVTVLAAAFCLVLYVEYLSNITSMQAAHRVNMGYNYGSYNTQIAAKYFDEALKVPYNLDPRETANYYSNFTASLVSDPSKNTNPQFVAEQVDRATAAQKAITEKVQNDPLLWMRLAMDEINKALIHNTDINHGRYAVEKAISLSPRRVELLQLRIQLDSNSKHWADAVKTSRQIAQLNPYNPDLRWQLAMALYLNNQPDDAVQAGDEAIAGGMGFTKLQQFAWYIQYYQQKGNYQKVIPLLRQAIDLEPSEIGLYADLARAYAKTGDKQQAALLARQVKQSDPSQTAAMQELIDSLK